jgi:hypothetical protein
MNKNVTSLRAIFFLIAIAMASCESHEQKADDAFDIVKKEKIMNPDSNTGTDLAPPPIQETAVKKTESQDEWTRFRCETEKKIVANENRVKEVKGTPNANSKLLKKAALLEKDNNDLRTEMDSYAFEMKVQLDKFKSKMIQKAADISAELKELATKDKK